MTDLPAGWGQRTLTFRLDVLSAAGSVDGTLHAYRDDPPTLENNLSRVVTRSLSGVRTSAAEYAAINPFVQRLRPVITIDGTDWPMGVLVFDDDARQRRSFGAVPTASLADLGYLLHQESDRVTAWNASTQITAAARQIFDIVGLTDYVIADSPLTFGTPVGWPPGTSRANILNHLARLLGYLPVHFDRNGTGQLRPLGTPPPVAEYVSGDNGNIIDGTATEADGLLGAANRYVVVDTGATEAPIVGTYDIPSSAPHSIASRGGFVVTRVIRVQGLTSETAAVDAARVAAATDLRSLGSVRFSTRIDPRHDTYDAVTYLGARWDESRWSLRLAAGEPMTHECRRVFEPATGAAPTEVDLVFPRTPP